MEEEKRIPILRSLLEFFKAFYVDALTGKMDNSNSIYDVSSIEDWDVFQKKNANNPEYEKTIAEMQSVKAKLDKAEINHKEVSRKAREDVSVSNKLEKEETSISKVSKEKERES